MRISNEKLRIEAETTGFRPRELEKVIQLLNLLQNFFEHPFLKNRLVLKGGTALNLFCFDVPRLSIDIDLNYIGSVSREEMEAERPGIEKSIKDVCEREGFTVLRIPSEHAGGKWRLRYITASGSEGNLHVDVNFVYRIPLWPVDLLNSEEVGTYTAKSIPVLNIHEFAAGKLCAMMSRASSRDLFDSHILLTCAELNQEQLRLAFIIYGAMNRKDWRTVSVDSVEFDPGEIANELIPMLRTDFISERNDAISWANRLIEETRDALGILFPFIDTELEFLNRLLNEGEIDPDLLTSNKELAGKIREQPMLSWKAQNVRKYKGRPRVR
jgi:predicted nucleotidyltransferase component of viral defense system